MIQLNLLPDVKLEYIKAQRSRRLVISSAVIVSLVAIGLLVILLSVSGLQKKHISDLTKDIASQSHQLQQKPQVDKILTVQNQLESLTALHAGKPAASQLFSYLNQVTPTQVNITSFNVDFTVQTMTITGTADALSSVNKYVDTLKFTKYTTDASDASTTAFNNVVLTSFGLSSGSHDTTQAATYTVNLAYDPKIFDITQKVSLDVPNLVTTRSNVDQPGDLFKAAPQPVKGSN